MASSVTRALLAGPRPAAPSSRPANRSARLSARAAARQGPPAAQPAGQEQPEGPCTSGRWDPLGLPLQLPQQQHQAAGSAAAQAAAAALAAAVLLLPAAAAHASEAPPPDGMLEFVINSIEALGPWGPAAFVFTVAVAECIPLFPTQPLSLASGLLFGAQKGSLCMLSGAMLAALTAFLIARGVGRPLAEKIISHELSSVSSMDASSSDGEGGPTQPQGPVQAKLAEVMGAIERGSFWQQAGAVLLLRLTPVVPYSASNYVLGLSPLPLAPYLAGTAAGMAFWSLFYASLGGASRSLLRSGVDPDVLLADLLDRASNYTRELAVAGVLLGAAALVAAGTSLVRRQLAGEGGSEEAGGEAGSASARDSGMPPVAAELGRDVAQGLATSGQQAAQQAARMRSWLASAAERLGSKELAESRAKD